MSLTLLHGALLRIGSIPFSRFVKQRWHLMGTSFDATILCSVSLEVISINTTTLYPFCFSLLCDVVVNANLPASAGLSHGSRATTIAR